MYIYIYIYIYIYSVRALHATNIEARFGLFINDPAIEPPARHAGL